MTLAARRAQGRMPVIPPLSRRSVLLGAAAASMFGGLPAARGTETFTFGLTPLFLDNDIELLSMLERYLVKRLDRSVALVKRRTYHEISAMLLSGQLDAAWICDDPYVQYQDKLVLLAVPLYLHKPLYQTYVIVNDSSDAQSFDDIRGTVHAFSDPDSTSGYLVTRWMLALRQTTPRPFLSRLVLHLRPPERHPRGRGGASAKRQHRRLCLGGNDRQESRSSCARRGSSTSRNGSASRRL